MRSSRVVVHIPTRLARSALRIGRPKFAGGSDAVEKHSRAV
jgi:hypothetical protein